jgi:hypothetical protein
MGLFIAQDEDTWMAAIGVMITMVLYFAATVSFLAYLLRRSEALSKVSLGITGLGFLSHTIALGIGMMEASSSTPPSFHAALSFFSWMLVLVFLVVEYRHRIHVLGSCHWCPRPRFRRLPPGFSPCSRPCGFMSRSACWAP